MGRKDLVQVLQPLKNMFPQKDFPNLIAGLKDPDDAAIYKIDEETAIVATVDFFPPVVDDPYDFGAVSAANALSDIFAMGGRVIFALNVCGFPADLPHSITSDILKGGADKVKEAGGAVAGGHTVEDKEPKYGLCVLGIINPKKMLRKSGAKAGDVLVLTKKLGTGIITTAAKNLKADKEHIKLAINSMQKLNKDASEIIQKVGINACTDITGFSLMGHSYEIASESNVRLNFDFDKIPFIDGATRYAEESLFPGGTCKNEDAFESNVELSDKIPDYMKRLLFTPETSGGLLISVNKDKFDLLTAEFKKFNHELYIIGSVSEGEGLSVN